MFFVIPLVVSSLIFTEGCYRRNKKVRFHMDKTLEASESLIVLDTGIIGMTSSDAVIGDIVCFVAGCSSLAVLRPQQEGQLSTYSVVGKCSMNLRSADSKKHHKVREDLQSHRNFEEVISELEQDEESREYDLV